MAPSATSPIGPGDRVIDVLERDERLVDVFVRHGSRFEKLRSPTVRRVMARLITVEQAAQMAGVDVVVLLRDLNVALLGPDGAHAVADSPRRADASTVPQRAARPAALKVVELDVREDMRLGREPFSRIMAAVGALGEDQALRLRTIFEPVPLFAVLAKRGFSHESREEATDDWSAWFWRATAKVQLPRLAALARDDDGLAALAVDDDDEVWLDVRGLAPPEPMLRTLAALERLSAGRRLVQINTRVPRLLLPELVERGYACEVDESESDRVLVRIWRPTHA